GRLLVGHGGSMPGFQAGVHVDRVTATGVVSMHNCTTAGDAPGTEDPFDVLDEFEPRLPGTWVSQSAVLADRLAPTVAWFWGASERRRRVRPDGRLRPDRASGKLSGARTRPTREATWVGLQGYFRGERLRVSRDAEGTPRYLDIATFVLTRRPYEPGDVVPGGLDEGGWPAR